MPLESYPEIEPTDSKEKRAIRDCSLKILSKESKYVKIVA